jgi:hypothetical protein
MKRLSPLLTLASLAVPTAAVVAQLMGVPVSTAFSWETSLSVFVTAFMLLLAISEYGYRRSDHGTPSPSILLRPAEVRSSPPSYLRSTRRHSGAFRRASSTAPCCDAQG